jgi:Cytochrome c3
MRLLVLVALASPLLAADRKLNCAQCHKAQSEFFATTGMSNALEPASHGKILSAHKKLTFAQGDYKYLIERDGDTSWYRVYNDREEFKTKIGWAFGLGSAGQTYLFERDGAWYEGRVSYYKDTDSLDLTVGARPDPPRSLQEAVGRGLSIKGAAECFSCHTTGALAAGVLRPETLTPGIQCQRCHTDSDAHQAGFASAGAPKVTPRKLGALAAEDVSEFCGQCHRTWQQIAADGPHNITNVRFQPYRLTNSKCYDAAETRIRCTTCHDVHAEEAKPASFFDAKCQACHSPGQKAGAHLCKVAAKDCASCHMPKVKIASAHNAFTDHWIRIAKPGAPVPY